MKVKIRGVSKNRLKISMPENSKGKTNKEQACVKKLKLAHSKTHYEADTMTFTESKSSVITASALHKQLVL